MIQTLKNLLSENWSREKIKSLLPDEILLKIQYKNFLGKKLNLKNPESFNEKIQWLKLYDRNPLYTVLVDKYEVRNYIAELIGEKYLVKLFGVYPSIEEIDFSNLPNQFVLKTTHDSGGVVLCKDKSNFSIEDAKKKLANSLNRNYYYAHREFPYKNVVPRIICEQLLVDEEETDLKDYKLMCFNGTVKCSFVGSNRNTATGLKIDFYDREWNFMPFERHYKNSGKLIQKPRNYEEMVSLAEVLSKEIPFVRVDFYEVNGQIYFGELTFYPGSGLEGFEPEKYDYLLGSWIKLPKPRTT